MEKGFHLKDGGQAKTLKAVKNILKTIKTVHAKDKVEEELSGEKLKEPALNPTNINKCQFNGHTHLWKDCPNNPISRKCEYTYGIHFTK